MHGMLAELTDFHRSTLVSIQDEVSRMNITVKDLQSGTWA